VAKRWQCLEVGCGAVVSAESDEELVEAVNEHVREAHGSYELEEMILAVAEDAPDEGEPIREEATR
jgi:predicted small metal-binding protein